MIPLAHHDFRPRLFSAVAIVLLCIQGVSSVTELTGSYDRRHRQRRNYSRDVSSSPSVVTTPHIFGVTFEYSSDKKRVEYSEHGSPEVLEAMQVRLRLYGRFTEGSVFRLTKFQTCDDPLNKEPELPLSVSKKGTCATVDVTMPYAGELEIVYLCVKANNDSDDKWVRAGDDDNAPWLRIHLYRRVLPTWIHIIFICILLLLSGLFSGLNLGLMSLNKTDLKIIINTGTSKERKHAAKIAPVRNHGNFLLCCLLFSNVLVNSSLTILVDDLTTGLIAIVMSTITIVIFGEIVPQAICSRHGLAVGARTIHITKLFMCLTAPLAFPLSKILDKILGEEIGSVYTRERLKELLRVTKDHHGLEIEEVGIISGALDMKTKTVRDVMTPLDQVFMLPSDAVLNFETMAEIEYQGYSRIPVYDGERSRVVALLNVKQLTLLDATDGIPLRTVIEYYHNKLFFVFENTRLDFMFKAFREGNRGHMAFIQMVNDGGPGDPYYETIGVVTMEDVLEELLQAEIMDESDIDKLQARLTKSNNQHQNNGKDAPYLLHKKVKTLVEIPAPLALAAVQFLSTTVEPFKEPYLSVAIIRRLMRTTLVFARSPSSPHGNQSNASHVEISSSKVNPYLYEQGKSAEYFIMILEGRVQVQVGQEKLTFEGGPFTTFGAQFLLHEADVESRMSMSRKASVVSMNSATSTKKASFISDYTVKMLTDLYYMKLKYSAYKAARLATELERSYASKGTGEDWEREIDKVLYMEEEEEGSQRKLNYVGSSPMDGEVTTGSGKSSPRKSVVVMRSLSSAEVEHPSEELSKLI